MRCSVRLSVLVLVVFGVQRGYCIECYSCSSKDNEACLRFNKNKVPLRRCDSTEAENTKRYAEAIDRKYGELFHLDISSHEPQLPMNCLKQVTKEGDQEVVLRGCQLAATEQLDICVKVKEINTDTLHTKYCTLCNTDSCNGACTNQVLALATVLSVAFLLRKIT